MTSVRVHVLSVGCAESRPREGVCVKDTQSSVGELAEESTDRKSVV